MWRPCFILLSVFSTSIGASVIFQCPEDAKCKSPGVIEATSFQFLGKLSPKQLRMVTSVTVSNASIDKVDPEIKYLKNLEFLDLSFNNIQISSIPSLPNLKVLKLKGNGLKQINLADLPQNIEELDLSNNVLAHVPKEWNTLKSLKILHLQKNPIDCDCYNYNVLIYEKMLRDGISVPSPVTCHLPKYLGGKDIKTMNCSLQDIMMYDEPEGSGAGEDIFTEATSTPSVPHLLEEEDDKDDIEIIDDKPELPPDDGLFIANATLEATTIESEEGSGDLEEEGSGFVPVTIPNIPACHINCSTPEPIGTDDENEASPLPEPAVQIKIVAEDIYHGINGETTTTPETTTTSTTTTTTTVTTTITPVTEPPILKEVDHELHKESDKPSDIEVFMNNTKTGEMEKATAINKDSYAVYVVIGVGLFLAVVFLVCLIQKRRKHRNIKQRQEQAGTMGEEMKPLTKNNGPPIVEKNGKGTNNIPEHIPLINGQNGKPKDDTPVLTSYTPVEHPEEPCIDAEEEEAELREKPNQDLLTPTRERVTIRASEIPDSIPKTPVLVDRKKNSDGEIITTVLP